ncbi:MAG TPA: SpoIIE family protein phosphatase [Acidimicrobiia bacterium]|nr:SpoIIE family protein phosphatase [Acidimicrobiia bacterium]
MASATSGEEALGVLADVLPEASLFAVDHSFTALVPWNDPTEDPRPLDGELYEAIASTRTAEVDGWLWTPVRFGRFPLYVVRQPRGADDLEPWLKALLGILFDRWLRFSDSLEVPRRRARMRVEAELQWSQVRSRADRLGGFEIAGTLEPAYRVAGDIFDFALNTRGVVTVFGLDAMGHGQTSTLSSVLAMAAIRNARLSGGDLTHQMAAADEALINEWGGDRFATIVGVEVSPTGLQVVNAGHEPLTVVTPNETSELQLDADPPAGVRAGTTYRIQDLPPLQPNETLVLLSDGAGSARNRNGDLFGSERLIESLHTHRALRPLPLVHELAREILAHSPDHLDDITVVAVAPVNGDV